MVIAGLIFIIVLLVVSVILLLVYIKTDGDLEAVAMTLVIIMLGVLTVVTLGLIILGILKIFGVI